MAEQTEERPFTADIADLFQREADGASGVGAYTMTLRCTGCDEVMTPQVPVAELTLPAFECSHCRTVVEVSFS